jgi:hypothetical protein
MMGDGTSETGLTVRQGLTQENSVTVAIETHGNFDFEPSFKELAQSIGLAHYIDVGQENRRWASDYILPWDPWG